MIAGLPCFKTGIARKFKATCADPLEIAHFVEIYSVPRGIDEE